MYRLDRALSVGVHRVLRLLDGHRKPQVPILMYHSIRDGVGSKHPYFEINTPPALLARHMRFLRDNGFTAIDLCEAVEMIAVGEGGGNRVAITFDDGYRDFYTDAFPILAEYGFTATVFIVSELIDERPTRKGDKEFMTRGEIREVHSHGIRIGSHTATHPKLHGMSPVAIENEIKQSTETLEDTLGESVRSFSYPFGFPEHDKGFVAVLRDLLQMYGYENGVSTIIGTAGRDHDWYFLPRLPVNSYDDIAFFQAKLEGGYDWMHFPQQIYKRAKRDAPWIQRVGPRRDAPEQAGT